MEALPINLLKKSTPSPLEKKLGRIPVLGSIAERMLLGDRLEPVAKEYKKILKERDEEYTLSLWAAEDREEAKSLMKILKESMDWKFPRFIPNDPCYVAFWSHHIDVMDTEEAIMNIEVHWGIELTENDWDAMSKGTLQDLINLIKQKANQSEQDNPITRP